MKIILLLLQEYVFRYHGKKIGQLEPHVYALAEAAHTSLKTCERNQSCVISGESGAGKTETTKFILQYLCSVTSNVSTWVEHQILEANTILEAFGNAKTVRNDNSSRFGKFMQVCFDNKWMIKGCIIQDYLLEQSRITFQSRGERNYHVFYQLLEGAKNNPELTKQFHLKPPNFYKYLNQSGCVQIEGVDDAKKLDVLRLAFNVVQVPAQMVDGIFAVISAILWLGNLEFEDVDGEKCKLAEEDKTVLATVSDLLKLNEQDLARVVLLRQINVRGNITEIPLKLQEAKENRNAMAKALYSRTFAWLVNHINTCTNPGQDSSRFLGVLDIFGFENFLMNSFEQLCINYTNEKLHKFFNHYVFALEQEIYRQEKIEFSHIQFTDNSSCLELIEKPPRCILKLLTEQCHMPKGSDSAYLTNLHSEFESHCYYVKGDDRRKWETEFGIRHYAGTVTYTVQGFVDKNRDVQQDVFFDFMSRSTNEFIQEITVYQDLLGSTVAKMGGTMARGTTKGKPTVSDTFRYQLQALVDVLQATNPWYVRCIKPNMEKSPNSYNEKLVLDQLKYLGMLEIIRIRKEGFPVHMLFSDFVQRFKCLSKTRLSNDLKEATSAIINTHNISKTEWQIGQTKVFLRFRAYDPLEDSRQKILNACAILIQRTWKGFVVRKSFKRKRSAVLKLQHAYRGWKQRIQFIKMRRAAIVIQSHLRGVFAREVAAALREMRRVEEEMRKREKLEEERKKREAEEEEERKKNYLEELERATQEQIEALNQIAEQINPKLMSTDHCGDSVDLDNLFAFLSDMQPGSRHNIIEEISSHMEDLVEDLDVELESVIQQELEGLTNGISNVDVRLRKNPSLPEPTMPPPPPPFTNGTGKPSAIVIPKTGEKSGNEPIYESVIPRDESNSSPPPLPTPPQKIRPKSPSVDHVQRNSLERSTSPRPRPPGSPQCHSRPNSRSSSGVPQNWKTHREEDLEKEQRRKFRVEKKLQELEEDDKERVANDVDDSYHDIVEFAQNFFNAHERSPEGTIMATLTRKTRKSMEMMPKYEMVTYYKGNTIPNSHIHMYDPDNVTVACAIFRDLCKFLRGELKPETEVATIQTIVGHGIEREELRDEIFVQCIRQVTNCPQTEWMERIWLLLCLCIVSFQPSKHLYKYFVCFLKKNLSLDGKLRQYVQWCLDNCNNNRVTNRTFPPSAVEISAMKRLGTIVCRFFFLDGRTKAIDVHPTDTAADAVVKLSDKLGLRNIEGWAIYESRLDGEEHVKAHDYLYDVIAAWEQKQNKAGNNNNNNTSFPSLSRRGNQTTLNPGENRFIFKKRLFRNSRTLSQDPVEINMLYAQAVHSVVKADDFPVSEKVALQLAGLQAQVALGDPRPDNNKLTDYYAGVDTYLPYRISKSRGEDVWISIISEAHSQYGTGRSELTAKALYLSCVMQYPLYGTTMYPVTYRGYWSYGNNLILGVNCSGLMLIKPDDKFVLYEYRYQNIESIFLDPSDSFITINLMRQIPDNTHKCFVFETPYKNEIGSLIVSYCPALANWIIENEAAVRKVKAITNEDRTRLYNNLVNARKNLVESDLLRKSVEPGGGFIRSTLRRLSKSRIEKLRADYGGEGEGVKGYPYTFWAFSKQPLTQSFSKIPESDEQIALQVFQLILNYAGLGQNGDIIRRAEDEHVNLLQTIMERCMRKDVLLNELYLQLIKQTTDHPDPNSRVNLRHWALLSLACSVALPPHKQLRKYLIAHLKRCASDCITEEGKYARFAEKCLYRTQGTRRRQWPPSKEEIMCTINRRPIYARFHLMDGQYHAIEFLPSATAREVMDVMKSKIGLKESAMGYAIYEVLGSSERSLVPDEKVADVMSKWERYRTATAAQANTPANGTNTIQLRVSRKQQHFFLFKKHLFLDQYMNLEDPVEKELLYHQVLHGLRCDRFPISEQEAVMLTALQAQLELGDCGDILLDYRGVASHCLAPRFVPNVPHECVAMHHQSLHGMTQPEAKKSFLNLIQSWPLHRATIFDVMQSFTSNWPRVLWLAVDQTGLHLLEHRSRNALVTYDYESILSYSPALNCLMIVTGSERKQSKVILTTSQAFQIANLIKEYCEVLQGGCENKDILRRRDGQQQHQYSSRPMSILHKPAPIIEQAAS
ncbi:myosin, putative [Pediculus humanus corporis]|uniref:Myosin, putative n=1 Tax=Pediculus humanus subsp. corporis TaxID=121224 RepID=E0VSH1_PEDHC|nr:myosin, putative [Pediculus humanus corporis]EEB16327.1 myosin, putative [Pediculus humanus corporis]